MMKRPMLAAFSILAITIAPPSRAEEPTAANAVLARQLGIEGMQLVEKKEWSLALEKLERAEALHHAPTILVRIAECRLALGRIVEGVSALERVARESLPEGAPRAFVAAKERARAMLEDARPRLARVVVDVDGEVPAGLELRLDGKDVTSARGLDIPANPGPHELEASAAGHEKTSQRLDLAEGERAPVALRLTRSPTAPALEAPSRHVAGRLPDPPAPRSLLVPWVVTGAGGAALVAGGVLGALALGAKSDLDARCTDRTCPDDAQGLADDARGRATASTIALGVGVTAVVAGVLLLASRPRMPAAPATTASWAPALRF